MSSLNRLDEGAGEFMAEICDWCGKLIEDKRHTHIVADENENKYYHFKCGEEKGKEEGIIIA